MTKEELLQMLQEKGMDENAVKALLEETLNDLNAAQQEPSPEEQEMAEKAEASKYLGVNL